MKVLITGASGFIGKRTADFLSPQYQVRATGRSPSCQFLTSNIDYKQADLSRLEDCQRVSKNQDVVIHCAGKASPWGPYSEFYSANVAITQNLLLSCQQNNVQRFIFLSSPSIYFNYKDQWNIKETDIPNSFANAYAKTKYLAELAVLTAHSEKLQTIALRPRFVIGAGDNNVLPRLIQLHQQKKLFRIGHGKNKITLTSIGNLLHAIELCLSVHKSQMGHSYNIGNPQPLIFWDFVDTLFQSLNLPKVEKSLPYWPLYACAHLSKMSAQLNRQSQEPALLPLKIAVLAKSMTLNLDLAKSKLLYNPKQSTQDGLKDFISDWNKRHDHEKL